MSWPVYLHFLDRELLGALRVYDTLPVPRVLNDLHWVLLTAYEWCFCSTSLVFENRFATLALQTAPLLFSTGHIQLALREPSLPDFIATKRDQYAHAPAIYPFYFDDRWQELQALHPQFLPRSTDTGSEVQRQLEIAIVSGTAVRHLDDRRGERSAALRFLERESSALVDALRGRDQRAVTKLILLPILEKAHTLAGAGAVRRSLELSISEAYITSYLDEYSGTVATGLSSAGDFFSYLCPTYPLHDLRLWKDLYRRFGVKQLLEELVPGEVAALREQAFFIAFIEEVRRWWSFELEKRKPPRLAVAGTIREEIGRLDYSPLKLAKRKGRDVGQLERIFLESIEVIDAAVARILTPTWLIGDRTMSIIDRRKVFVVHGKDDDVRRDLFALLRSAGLSPTEFTTAIVEAGGASRFVQEIIDRAMERAQAIVVLFTPDEFSSVRDELVLPGTPKEEGFLPRPNVLFEAGLALGRYPDRTIIVQVGTIRPISDLTGRHVVYLDNSVARRKALLSRLAGTGCTVDLSGEDWLSVGEFG